MVLLLGYSVFVAVSGILLLSRKGGATLGILTIGGAVLGLFLGGLLWRIACELVLAIFRIFDELRALRESTASRTNDADTPI
jgi:hypothetical protein